MISLGFVQMREFIMQLQGIKTLQKSLSEVPTGQHETIFIRHN
jgi:hypothetical protein